jgi:hypothetical protein
MGGEREAAGDLQEVRRGGSMVGGEKSSSVNSDRALEATVRHRKKEETKANSRRAYPWSKVGQK